jgi:hypothetical protein
MLWTDHQKRPGSHISREIYRERCRDEEGKRYSVIVYEDEIGITTYRLEDGTEVRYVDGCEFEIVERGKIISRCED